MGRLSGPFAMALVLCLLCQEARLQQSVYQDADTGLTWSQLTATIPSGRVFRIAFNPTLFYWSEGNFGGVERPSYRYTPSLRGKASLASWIHYKYSPRHKAGFIFGVPPQDEDNVELDVLAQNQVTMEYGLLRLSINVTTPDDGVGQRVVQMKIDNLNMEDMFDAHRLNNLKAILTENIWPEANPDLHLTSIGSAIDFGFRHPSDPGLKDGVVVHLGSSANFSRDILFLDQEVSPLRNFPNCPRDFKRTSVERFFREKGFAMDWCHFRLLAFDARWNQYYELGSAPEEAPASVDYEEELSQYLEAVEDTVSYVNVTNGTFIILNGNISTLLQSPLDEGESNLTTQSLMRDKTNLFIWIIIIALGLTLGVIICMCFLLCCSARHNHGSLAISESMGLVLSDCFGCCCKSEKTEKASVLRAEREFEARMRNDPRFRRASSVQRQTDTIRRLAQQRCVTPKLQSPIQGPDPNLYLPRADVDTPFSGAYGGYDELADGGPIILLSDDESPVHHQSAQGYPSMNRPSTGSRMATLNRRSYYGEDDMGGMDPLGSLKRPAPPSYGGRPSDWDHATYLV